MSRPGLPPADRATERVSAIPRSGAVGASGEPELGPRPLCPGNGNGNGSAGVPVRIAVRGAIICSGTGSLSREFSDEGARPLLQGVLWSPDPPDIPVRGRIRRRGVPIPPPRCRYGLDHVDPAGSVPGRLRADKGNDYDVHRRWLRERGIVPRIARRGIARNDRLGRYRWKIERTEAEPQLTSPATRMAFDADYDHVLTMQARRRRLDTAIEGDRCGERVHSGCARMCCLRGVSTLTGFGLAVEIGDWNRFTGNSIGSFVGLVPSEHSSGSPRVQESITRTGNTHARRLLVEAAWHHRPRYHIGAVMRSRWDQAPARARGDAGNRRLHQRWVGFLERRKRPVTANRTWPSPGRWQVGAGHWR